MPLVPHKFCPICTPCITSPPALLTNTLVAYPVSPSKSRPTPAPKPTLLPSTEEPSFAEMPTSVTNAMLFPVARHKRQSMPTLLRGRASIRTCFRRQADWAPKNRRAMTSDQPWSRAAARALIEQRRRQGKRIAIIWDGPRPEWFPSDHGKNRWPTGEEIELFCKADQDYLRWACLKNLSAFPTITLSQDARKRPPLLYRHPGVNWRPEGSRWVYRSAISPSA